MQNLLVLDRPEAILPLAPLLMSLAARCGQAGAMHWLPYFLDEQVTGRRMPCLVLTLRPETSQGGSLVAEDIEAAALFFEYRIFGMRTGAVATGDAVGFNSIIAPAGHRTRVAALAARALVERGASVVLATFEGSGEPDAKPMLADWPGMLSAERHRQVGRTLRLLPTLDATLAQMGKGTRFNLRYYRRRLERRHPCAFVPEAAEFLRHVDLQAINAASLNPLPEEEFIRRVRSAAELPGSFLCGLRDGEGRWLSLLGGWRQNGTTVLHWQMNTAGFEKDSIGTVMRSFFLEHEIGRGAESLLIFGGTPHPMRSAFTEDRVADLIVRRRTLRAGTLCWAARFFADEEGLSQRGNFLATALRDPQLRWSAGAAPARDARLGLGKTTASRRTA